MADWKEFQEHGVRAGLGTALCVRIPSKNETKYHIFTAVESLPAVFGSPESITFSSTTNMSVTSVKGKNTTESVEITIPYNIDNIVMLDDMSGEICDFAYIDLDDFSGQEFSGEVSYHLSEVSTDSIKTITVNIAVSTPKSQITLDLYDLFEDTVAFSNSLPTVVRMKTSESKTVAVNLVPADATMTVSTGTSSSVATATKEVSSNAVKIEAKAKGTTMFEINATKEDYASNKRTIKVIVE